MGSKVLLIYTGGTIGMIQDPISLALKPFTLPHLLTVIPELERFNFTIHSTSFSKPIDSSNATPELWVNLITIIEDNYSKYDGFVILHGTDTMAYTASALSFALSGLSKPVIITGSQLPLGTLRTDGKENIISSIEIASSITPFLSKKQAEVCIYFNGLLYRGNRTIKSSTQHFEAFESPNYPPLAEVGVEVNYKTNHFLDKTFDTFMPKKCFCPEISVLYLFPGINLETVQSVFSNTQNSIIIMHSFGSGNGPVEEWFLNSLKEQIKKGKTILNITQCDQGKVHQGKYESGNAYKKIGVVGGYDMTFEVAVTKSMFLLGQGLKQKELQDKLIKPLCGELTL